jgi:3-hydroxybutyryl-CoA dehydrogenase
MEIKHIGIVGAGKMGTSIAITAAMAGYQVILDDQTDAILETAQMQIEKQFKKFVAKKSMTEEECAATMARIQTTSTFEQFETVDFVIESVVESLDIKTATFTKLEALCKKETIIVSNTSTFSITALAAATQRPTQVAGMHFFLPPIKLIEITRGYDTSNETVAQVKAVAIQMGKICVEVKKDMPGFIANRIYTPLLIEAIKVYEEGIASMEDIDMAMKLSYGLPIGPFELADAIGLDVLKSSWDYYHSELGSQWSPPLSLKQLVKAGRLGRKTGKGWYEY